MKKILTVSLMAMMVVGAARADIASVGYVDEKLATKANASDVTSISNKLGTVAEGKTVVDLIAAAKQEAIDAAGDATYNDTEVRGLIGDNADAISALETKVGNSSVADQIDAVRATTIAGLPEEQKQTMVPSVFLTEQMIQSSTNEIGGMVGDNATAIQDINNSAVMKSGITADKVTAYDAYAGTISANTTAAAAAKSAADAAQADADAAQAAADAAQADADANAAAIAAINNSENGLLKQAEAAAKAYADSLATNYDAKGAAATAKSEAIAAAKTAGDAAYDAKGSATQALTDAKAYAKDYADDVAATAKSEAIAAAKSAGDAAYDAKGAAEAAKTAAVAAAKEAADAAYAAKSYETRVQANETAIAANTAAAAAAKSAADAAQADADANTQAIDKINIASAQLLTQGAGDGQYALTMTKSGDSLVYKWEMIGR